MCEGGRIEAAELPEVNGRDMARPAAEGRVTGALLSQGRNRTVDWMDSGGDEPSLAGLWLGMNAGDAVSGTVGVARAGWPKEGTAWGRKVGPVAGQRPPTPWPDGGESALLPLFVLPCKESNGETHQRQHEQAPELLPRDLFRRVPVAQYVDHCDCDEEYIAANDTDDSSP